MQTLSIQFCKSPEEAPNYSLPEHKFAQLIGAVVVGKGTVEGNPTVDLVFVDESGQKYIAMVTMNLLRGVVGRF